MASVKGVLKAVIPGPAAIAMRKLSDELGFRFWQARLAGDPVLQRPIFMVGCPRSGTSIAVRLYAQHPEVANRTEAGLIWDPENYANPEADHHWEADLVTEEDVRRLHARFEYYRQRDNKARLINKHPRSSVRIGYIRKVFPDAHFIHVIRDGRAVANSIVNRTRREPVRHDVPFGDFCKPPHWRQFLRDDPYEQAALQWREIVSYVLTWREALGSQYHEFRYEEMCARPRAVFAAAFQSAGLPVSDEILLRIPETLKDMNHKYREQLSQEQIQTITLVQHDLLKELGYEV